jgi:hypothetical protein
MAQTAFKYDGAGYQWVRSLTGFSVFWAGVLVGNGGFLQRNNSGVTTEFGTFYRGAIIVDGTSTDRYEVAREIPVSAPTYGSVVFGADYNGVQTMAAGILGTGAAYGGPSTGYGYGQPVASSPVTPTDPITKTQWNNLVADLNKLSIHQRGSNMYESANILANVLNNPISFENLQLLNDNAMYSVSQRQNVSFINTTLLITHEGYVPYEWAGVGELQGVSSAVTITWASQNDMYYWFNMGGFYNIVGRTNGTSASLQEDAWFSLMSGLSATFSVFDLATAIAAGGAEITLDTSTGATTPYDAAVARIYARVTNPGDGQLRQLRLRVYYEDNHSPVPEGIDGVGAFKIGYAITEQKITGAVNGAFDAPSNTVSVEFF